MIKGLSERLRLVRRGKIRLGEKKISKKTGKEYPVALDYFVVPDEVKKIYGDTPRKLDIMLPMEGIEYFFPQFYKRYGSSRGLLCRGNGEIATQISETNEMTEIRCLGKDCSYSQSGECKPIGNLQVILSKIRGLGIYQIDTSSYNSIVNLNSGIEMIRGMLGRISWIPLILEVGMRDAHPVVGGKKIKTTIPVMSITADATIGELLKMRLAYPTKEAMIDNPQVDEKPELLFMETKIENGKIEPDKNLDKITPAQIDESQKLALEIGYKKLDLTTYKKHSEAYHEDMKIFNTMKAIIPEDSTLHKKRVVKESFLKDYGISDWDSLHRVAPDHLRGMIDKLKELPLANEPEKVELKKPTKAEKIQLIKDKIKELNYKEDSPAVTEMLQPYGAYNVSQLVSLDGKTLDKILKEEFCKE